MKKLIKKTLKLATVEISGKSVDFYEPPHTEPDFPWLNAHQFLKVLFPNGSNMELLRQAQRDHNKATKTIAHDGEVITIICHSMAQVLATVVDKTIDDHLGKKRERFFKAYSAAMATVVEESWPMTREYGQQAFENSGNHILKKTN